MTFRCTNKAQAPRGIARLTLLAAAILLPTGAALAEEAAPVDGVAQAVRAATPAKADADPAFEGRIGCASIDLAGNRGIGDDAGLGTALTLTKAGIVDGSPVNKAI